MTVMQRHIIPNSFIYLQFIPESLVCFFYLLQLFEKRAKKLKQKEGKLWKHVTADVMSEEEEYEDGFIRHRQSWRSRKFNRLIEKLDSRCADNEGKVKARKRVYGEECERPIPPTIPYWMKETSSIDSVAGGNPSSEELISSGPGDEATDQ